jgi:glucose dehydrogenase
MSNPSNWASQAGDYANHRYSTLDQINAKNVSTLQVAWTMSTGVLRGHEGSPLVVGNTMYIHTPFPNNVYAINLADQTYKWKYEPKQDATVVPVMCCDTVNRGLAFGDGKIFLQQADTTLVALDATTGKVDWTVKNGNPKIGETNTTAPHVFGKVIPESGGEFGVHGRMQRTTSRPGNPGGVRRGQRLQLLSDQPSRRPDQQQMAPDRQGLIAQGWKGDSGNRRRRHWAGIPMIEAEPGVLQPGGVSTWNPDQRPGDNKGP